MNDKVLETKLDNHMQRHAEFKEFVITELTTVKTTLDAKVTYQHFVWITGIMIVVLTAILGYISWQVNSLSMNMATNFEKVASDVTSVKTDVAAVKGKLDPYNVEFKN